MELSRRDILTTPGLFALAGVAGAATTAATAPVAIPGPASADVTRTLARYVLQARKQDLPDAIRHEAARTLLNYMGVAVGGSNHETINVAVAALAPFSGPAQAGLYGRRERFDILHAALINGISSHVLDFDDTHLRTVIHPGGPVISALLALAESRTIRGDDFINALVIGVEVECRIGNAVYPAHYSAGWHITGTTGVFGAAAATGRILGLTEQQMLWALGLAATQPVGLQEMFGSMTKSFHPGRAAQNGLTSALLAARNFTSSTQALEARYGWCNVLSSERHYAEITGNLGSNWQIALNTYKPFACGIVMHPTIDGCIQLRNQYQLTAAAVDRIELRVHPLVLSLTGKATPQTGLEGKFSIFHAAAAAIVEGAGGIAQFSDRAVRLPEIITLRSRVHTTVDPAIKEDQVRILITLKDGRMLEKFIEHAVGSIDRPLPDRDLEAKVAGLADGILTQDRIRQMTALCWNMEKSDDAALLARSAATA
jgi:2-methylcitrate dehydratase PrpD